jgi:hypothetical protein
MQSTYNAVTVYKTSRFKPGSYLQKMLTIFNSMALSSVAKSSRKIVKRRGHVRALRKT